MFTSPVFLGLLVLLAASLMSCTYTTQIPLVKVAKRFELLRNFNLFFGLWSLEDDSLNVFRFWDM